ncbi:AzlD domain-containing protein [Streptococcus cameli]
MNTSHFVVTVILLGFLVSWIPRVAPFILVKYKGLPSKVVQFLRYLPLSILFALTVSSLFQEEVGRVPRLQTLEFLAAIPTLYIAYKSKNLLYAVLTGIICMAVIRLAF